MSNIAIILIISGCLLVIGVILYFALSKRTIFNRHKFVRLVRYNSDMSIKISYIKRAQFNQDNAILINPKHIYNFKGYTTIVVTDQASESINPIDFESKYDRKDYQTAIRSKLIGDTFQSLKVSGIDKIAILLVLNIIQLLMIAYLLYSLLKGGGVV